MATANRRITQRGLGVAEGDDETDIVDFCWDPTPPVTCPSSAPPAVRHSMVTLKRKRETLSREEDE